MVDRVTSCVKSIPHATEPLVLRIINDVSALSLSNRKAFQPNSIDFTSGRSAPHIWTTNELSNTTLIQSRNDSTPNVADCNLDKPLDNTPKHDQLANTAILPVLKA